MIIIVDHGATTSRWWCFSPDTNWEESYEVPGFNPRYTPGEDAHSTLIKARSKLPHGKSSIFFYSTGVYDDQIRNKLWKLLMEYFSDSDVEICTDLTGVGRGLLGDEGGLAVILGTGSNAGLYENHRISFQPLSLGYLLGDEGSGAFLGKMLLKEFLEDRFPGNLVDDFEKLLPGSKQDTITWLQSQPQGKKLADFATFAFSNKSHPYIVQLLEKSFASFFEHVVSRIKENNYSSLVASGTIAWLYEDVFRKVADQYGYSVKRIVKDPMEDLITYHKKQI